jgi:hypothetical protein
VLCSSLGLAFVEITEATDAADQREMSLSENAVEAMLLGSLGGRGSDGFSGDAPVRLVADDIVTAIKRKLERYPREIALRTILGVYINSNPGLFVDVESLSPCLAEARALAEGFLGVVVFRDMDGTEIVLGESHV